MSQLASRSEPLRAAQGTTRVNTLDEHHRCWKNNPETGFLDPTWPREPDLEVARKLAIAHLPTDTFRNADIAPFAQGAFHRLYSISSTLTAAEHLMRVALPVDPFYKTESEVATMEYIRRYSSIPVPRVIAFASSASNELGFEWILMEKVDGLPLDQFWDAMPFDAKSRLTVELASCLKQLRERTFPLLGNIYFADVWSQVGYAPITSSSQTPDIGVDGTFVIGRMVSTRFFRDKRLLLPADRGPFETARELAVAETKLVGQRIRHLSPIPDTDYYCETDDLLNSDVAEVLHVFDKLDQAVSHVFSAADGPEDDKVLWHSDLSSMNVLVHPDTYELAGIVDWESVSIVPFWDTGDQVPQCLRGIEVAEPPLLGSVPDDEEEDLVEIRKDWELVLLRRKYLDITRPSYDITSVSDRAVRRKMQLSRFLGNFEDRWESARYWLKQQFPDEEGICSDGGDSD